MKKTIYLVAVAVLFVVLAVGIIFAVLLRSTLLGDSWNIPVSTEKTLDEIAEVKQKTPEKGLTTILLEGSSASIDGSGANFYGGVLTIREGGNYEISGTLDAGQIVVNPKGREAVTLYLDGVKVYHPYESALEIKNDGHTLLVLKKETVSRLQTGEKRDILPVGEGEGTGAAVSATKDLYIAGDGALQVLSYINNALDAAGSLVIESGQVDAVAANIAFKGDDAVIIRNGEFSLRSGGDGIQSNSDAGENHGVVSIADGEFILKSGGDGIQAQTLVDITGGIFTIDAGTGLEESWQRDAADAPSAKGIKSGKDIRLADSSVAVQCPDDAVHATNGLVFVSGSCTLQTSRVGLYAGGALTIANGTLHLADTWRGVEGSAVTIHKGKIYITAEEDGVHTTGSSADAPGDLTVEGGRMEITSGGSAFYAQGALNLKHGTLIMDGPKDAATRPLYSRGECTVGRASLLICDDAGKTDTSCFSRRFILRRFSETIPEGSQVSVTTRSGGILIKHQLSSSATSIIYTSPQLLPWRRYQLIAGDRLADPELRNNTRFTWLDLLDWVEGLKWW